ncbi:hypothetical protein ECG_04877 [Echinococcus granulosus]|uniref:Expressed conserved protein n=1 Tax=Echinococcus granulosus TaxID=6210 RepID=U6IYL5_ECHGR|nr:hypothetical protein ECG_04877 [Echinococcus granulosus]CDS16789.1 expressed conserved protein [Echinococcus granulosus]CDS16800.1 hypothetical protein EgrG_000950300 [Echinococcus granulosus]
MSFPQPTNFLLVIAALIYFCVVCVNSHTLDSSWSDSDSSDMEIGENEALVKDLVATMGNLSPDQRHAVMKFIKSVYLALKKENFDLNVPGKILQKRIYTFLRG